MKFKRNVSRKPERCKSDLSRDPGTLAGMGSLPCEVQGPHEVHERRSAPIAARWTERDGTRIVEFMRSVEE